MKAIYDPGHAGHDPQFFLQRGQVRRTTELPERADRLLAGQEGGVTTSGRPSASASGQWLRSTRPSTSRSSPKPMTPGGPPGPASLLMMANLARTVPTPSRLHKLDLQA
jgi:hypothetical protein